MKKAFGCGKKSNIRSQILVYGRRLFASKTYPKFVTLDNFLRNLWPKKFSDDRQRNFKMSDGKNINYRKIKTFPTKKKYENRNTRSKVMVEHPIKKEKKRKEKENIVEMYNLSFLEVD